MLDTIDDVAAFYDEDPAREHARLEEHQLEYELTWRFLDRHLPREGRVLDLGAGTGRYSLELARRGYEVTAIDLSPGLIQEARVRAATEGLEDRVRFAVGDARDPGALPDARFDAVLLMGPLYHLVEEADRRSVVSEAHARLVSGGVIFSAFLSRLGVLGDFISRMPEWIEDRAHVRSFLDRGRRPDDAPRGGFRGHFAKVEEIAPLHEAEGFETITLVGVEPAISADDESFNSLAGRRRDAWLDLLEKIAAEDSIVGASRHLLYIGRKGRT